MKTHPASHYRQSGVIPYRGQGGRLEVLLVTSRSRRRWVIPKGVIAPGMGPRTSALKEALEEAGLEGEIVGSRLGTYVYEKWGGVLTVRVFAMAVTRVHDAWEEDFRDRVWLRPKAAAARVREVELRRLLIHLPRP